VSIGRARTGNLAVVFLGWAVVAAVALSLSAAHAAAAEPPIAAYSFDEGSGEGVGDVFGEHNGTISGPTWAEGKYGTALRFDGGAEEDCVTVAHSPDLELTGNFTMEAWVRPEGSLFGDTILFKEFAEGTGPTYFLAIGFNEKGKLQGEFVESEEPEVTETVVSPKALPEYKWTHVAFSFDGAKQRLYVNGELVATNSATGGAVASSGPLQIGCAKGWESDYFWGKIDEVRIYDRTLPVGEIEADRDNAIQTPPSPFPVAAYSFDAGEGEVAEDSFGAHEGAIEGASWTEGKFGNALSFDGAAETNCVTVPDSPDLELSESFTVEAWIRPEGSLIGDTILFKELEAESGPSYVFSVGFDEAGKLEGTIVEAEEGEVVQEVVSPEPLPEYKWTHVAFSFDGEKQKLYVNGELVATHKGGIGALASEGPLQIGCAKGWEADYFWGKIDELRIYHRALTTGEIEADRDAAIQTPLSKDPVAAFTLDEGEGTTATDLTGTHNGTVEGAAWSEGKWGAALEFDGVTDCLTVPDRFDLQLREAFTLEAWINPSATDGSGPIIYKESGGFLTYALALGLEPGPYYVPEGALAYEPTEAAWVHGETIPKEAWSHVALSYDGESMRLYVNSELVDVEEAPGAVASAGDLRIGCAPNSEEFFGGRIDEVRLYNRALPAGEIESDSKNDHAAPKIELSGSLTEGLKEGTSEYLLKVKATDGAPGRPGVGVKKITISVDGEVADSVEQECPGGSCSLTREWTYSTAVYGSGPREVVVRAEDLGGEASSTDLELAEPNGSIPACNPLNPGEITSTPDEVVSLPGGGKTAIYHAAGGLTYEFPEPPNGFNPVAASAEELETYGYPERPSEPKALEEWESEMSEVTGFAPAMACSGFPRQGPENAGLIGAVNGETITSQNWSGYIALDATGADRWNAGKGTFTAANPNAHRPICGNASVSNWVGIGGLNSLLQTGFEYRRGGYFGAFVETIPAGGAAPPVPVPLVIKPGNRVEAYVRYSEGQERVYYWLYNKSSGRARPVRVSNLAPAAFFEGSFVDFIDERQSPRSGLTNLANFGGDQWGQVMVRRKVGGEWSVIGHNPRIRVNMTGPEGTGQTLASPGGLGPAKSGFLNSWHHCHE